MYELDYVNKRKKKRRAVIFGSIGTIGIATFAIVAFLGRYVGSFTVSLESKNVDLTLSEHSSFEDKSSFLTVKNVPSFQEFTYRHFNEYGGNAALDDEKNDSMYGANPNNETLNFFKYTFFLKNEGVEPAKYDFSLKIKENVASQDGRTLEDTLRVIVFDNGKDTIYAKGNLNSPAPVSVSEEQATEQYPFEGYATNFASSDEVMHEYGVEIIPGELRRYTIVTWLEGFRSSSKTTAPKGATMKLGVEINAYEKQ